MRELRRLPKRAKERAGLKERQEEKGGGFMDGGRRRNLRLLARLLGRVRRGNGEGKEEGRCEGKEGREGRREEMYDLMPCILRAVISLCETAGEDPAAREVRWGMGERTWRAWRTLSRRTVTYILRPLAGSAM